MEALEFQILSKRQQLRDLLTFALKQAPVFLPMVKKLKNEISVCDLALTQLHSRRAKARLG